MEKYILFGAGVESEFFVYENLDILSNIIICVDSNKHGLFHGIKIIKLAEALERRKTEKIIISAGDYVTFVEMSKLLQLHGLVEFDDYIWSKCFNKKIVCINANCHGNAVNEYLNASNSFIKQFFVYPLPAIQNNELKRIPEKLLENIDVYIHQDIRSDNAEIYKLSDDYVRSKLKEGVIDICIPNLVGMGKWMYPNLGGLDKILYKSDGSICCHVFYRNRVLDQAVNCCQSINDYVKFWNEYTYDKNIYSELWDAFRIKIKKREENWDIKIADFIFLNYKKIPMLVDGDHPSIYLTKVICEGIGARLGISDVIFNDLNIHLGIPSPVLPSVKSFFDIDYEYPVEKSESYLRKRVENELEDYIRAYVWWYHDIIIN